MEDSLVGTRINRYKILDCINKTELIGLYQAFDTKLERNVLMKMVLHSVDYSEESVEYFLNESRLLAKLSHPNIAKVLDFGYEDGNLFLISEYFSGKTLAELMTGPMAWQRAIEILIPLTDALAYAHSKGILHRDLKPENIVLTVDDRPILSDFSLVRIIEAEETRDMTGTNVGLGSPAYLSPEQGKGLPAEFRSDIYSLGVIFFEMVTGQKPFTADTSMEIVIQHVMTAPPSPKGIIPELPATIDDIILTSLSKDLDKRYQTMQEFSNALKSALASAAAGESQKSKSLFNLPSAVVYASALAIVILVGVAAIWGRTWIFPKESSIAGVKTGQTLESPPTSTAPAQAIGQAAPLPTNTAVPVDPFAAYAFPAIPVLPGAQLPVSANRLNSSNVSDVVELARWGDPAISQFAFIDHDQILLAATSAGVYYLDPLNMTPRYFFDTKGMVSTFSVSADEQWVATGDINGTVAVWNLADGSEIARFPGNAGAIKSLDFSPDKSKLVSSATDKIVRIWDIQQKTQVFALQKHALNINKVLFSPDGQFVISGGDDFQIMIWNASTGQLTKTYSASQKINDMTISSDGIHLAIALNSAAIEIWDLQQDKRINTITDPKIVVPFTSIQFLPNNQLVLTSSADGFVRVWNILGAGKIWETPAKDASGNPIKLDPVKTTSVSRDGSKFVTMSVNGLAELWDLSKQNMEISKHLGFDAIKRLAVSPDDRTIAFQSGDSLVEIWSTVYQNQTIQINGSLPRGNPFSPNSQDLLVQSGDLELYAIDSAPPALLFTLYDFPANGSIDYSPDGKMVIGSINGLVAYWSTFSGRELVSSSGKNEGNCRVLYRQDGSFLAAGSINGVINSDENLKFFCQVPQGPRTISERYLPDGSIIVLALQNQLAEIWSTQSGDQKNTIKSQSPGDTLDVAVSSDGQLLASASAGGSIEIYDFTNMKLLKTLDLHSTPVNQVTFSNDGMYIISGSTDGTVRFWGLRP